jgi:hypothetical protein
MSVRTARASLLSFLIIGALLSGCVQKIPLIREAIACPVPVDKLQEHCAEPGQIPAGATYADVIRIAIDDRKNLKACGVHDRYLASNIQECNEAIERHNAALREINQRYAGKP